MPDESQASLHRTTAFIAQKKIVEHRQPAWPGAFDTALPPANGTLIDVQPFAQLTLCQAKPPAKFPYQRAVDVEALPFVGRVPILLRNYTIVSGRSLLCAHTAIPIILQMYTKEIYGVLAQVTAAPPCLVLASIGQMPPSNWNRSESA